MRKIKRSLFYTLCIFLSPISSIAQSNVTYEAIRDENAQPIITQSMFDDAGNSEQGENINGPSVIRIPDWIAAENRANPEAQYYIYFAHHHGSYIRMAWAAELAGPWHLYHMDSTIEVGKRGVLDLGDNVIPLANGITIPNNHLASPDVLVDDENQRIILYFHSGSSTYVNGKEVNKQLTYVSTSNYGLNFYSNIQPVFLGPSYFRVFTYNGNMYALTNSGTPYKAPDIEHPWTAPAGFDFTDNLWDSHPDNPFKRDLTDDGIASSVLRVRHTGVRVYGDELHVFYSRRGDSPERIQMSTIDLSVGDWTKWDATYPATELFRALPGWEGGQFVAEPSETSTAPENVNQLRDPYFFEDSDGLLYLFYTGCGEDAIGYVQMLCHDPSLTTNSTITNNSTGISFSVYPNPSSDFLVIRNPSLSKFRYQVYATNGKLVAESDPVSDAILKVDLSGNEQGVYMIKVYAESIAKPQVFKVIKM